MAFQGITGDDPGDGLALQRTPLLGKGELGGGERRAVLVDLAGSVERAQLVGALSAEQIATGESQRGDGKKHVVYSHH